MPEAMKSPIEPPDAPEPVRWLRWLRHHFAHEGKVIRQAPGAVIFAVLLLAAIAAYAEWSIFADHYGGQIDDLKTANSQLNAAVINLQSTIQFLNSRLGESGKNNQYASNWTVSHGPYGHEKSSTFRPANSQSLLS